MENVIKTEYVWHTKTDNNYKVEISETQTERGYNVFRVTIIKFEYESFTLVYQADFSKCFFTKIDSLMSIAKHIIKECEL